MGAWHELFLGHTGRKFVKDVVALLRMTKRVCWRSYSDAADAAGKLRSRSEGWRGSAEDEAPYPIRHLGRESNPRGWLEIEDYETMGA